MLEVQVYKESTSEYVSLDLFRDEGVDLEINAIQSFEIDERIIDYTDSFDIPLTKRNSLLIGETIDKIKSRLKNGSSLIYGYLYVDETTYYTPNSTITVNFVSIVKYVMDKMKETKFADLFKDYTETGATEFALPSTGDVLNDGNYGFYINENGAVHNDDIMTLTAVNQSSDQYSEDAFPVYFMESNGGSRNLLPSFKLSTLIDAIFSHFGVDVDTTLEIIDGYDYSDVYIRIPTNFKSDGNLSGEFLRNVIYYIATNGWISRNVDSYTGVQTNNSNPVLFSFRNEIKLKDPLTEDLIIYNCHTPQENTRYKLSCNATRDNYLAKLRLSYTVIYDTGGIDEEIEIPENVVTYSGVVAPAIGIYLYDDLIYSFKHPTSDCFYNQMDAFLDDIEGILTLKYGDAVRVKLGFYADNLIVTIPETYYHDTATFSSATKDILMYEGFFHDNDPRCIATSFISPYNGMIVELTVPDISITGFANEETILYGSYATDGSQNTNFVTLTTTDGAEPIGVEARYGDFVNMYLSYSDTDLTMYDVIDTIVKRFCLSIKDVDGNELVFQKEQDVSEIGTIILDSKVSEGIHKKYVKTDNRILNIANEEYGNINDRVDALDDENKILIYDVSKYLLNDSALKEKTLSLNSTLQNTRVYGNKISSSQADSWDFMKVENNSAMWNISLNDKIDRNSLPISFGIIASTGIKGFRVPRAVFGGYSDTLPNENYPNASIEGREAINGLMVVEHKLFDTNGTGIRRMYAPDDFNLSDGKGGINQASAIYKNFEGYIKRNSSDAVILEVEAYLTSEEIMNIRNGYKVQLFGEVYIVNSVSNIQFEKKASMCTLSITKYVEESSITFDSDTISFDSDTVTWDMI